HKNKAVRIAAIKSLRDKTILLEMANNDASHDVRREAIRHIDSLPVILKVRNDHRLQGDIDIRFSTLLEQGADDADDHPEISQRLKRINNPVLNKKMALAANAVALRRTAIELIDSQPVLAECVVSDNNADNRLLAASQLTDEALIRSTLKQLGRKDKRTAQALRQHLAARKQAEEADAQAQALIQSVESLGHDEHWQRDQTRLNTLRNQWEERSDQVSDALLKRWEQSTQAADQRLGIQRQQVAAQQPIQAAKISQCELIEGFLQQLQQRQRISEHEAVELGATLDVFLQDWDDIEGLPEAMEVTLANRFHQGLHRARQQIETLQKNAQKTRYLEQIIHRAEGLCKAKSLRESAVVKLDEDWNKQKLPTDPVLAEEYRQHFSRVMNQLKYRLEKQDKARASGLKKVEGWLSDIEETLAQDKLGDAVQLQRKIDQTLKSLPGLTPQQRSGIDQRLHDCVPKIRQLQGWRHWGTDQAREALVAEAIELKAQDHSVADRAKAVRDLRQRWKSLGEIDPAAGNAQWKQFDEACSAAYALCQSHYDEEAKKRQQHLAQRVRLCEQMEAFEKETDWSSPDWRSIDKQYNQFRNQWRQSGAVARKDWKAIFERYKKAEAALESHVENERRVNLQRRQGLIEKLEGLKDHEDLAEAIQAAKDAQRAWQPTVMARRSEEQKMWKRFRAAADAIFDRETQRRESASAAERSDIEQKEKIITMLEQLSEKETLSGSELADAKQAWHDSANIRGPKGKSLERRYNEALAKVDLARDRQQLKRQLEQMENLFERQQFLDQLEMAIQTPDQTIDADIEQTWSSLQAVAQPAAVDQAMALRFEQAAKGTIDNASLLANEQQRAALLLALEILLDLDSPAEYAQQRMEHQVARLANAMNSGEKGDQIELSHQKISNYCQQGPAPLEPLKELSKRFQVIADQMVSELKLQIVAMEKE
ncbi:MAG TPA: DUF349 domain-containing protein, partial [Gammaproteobacteria bacterium]|nr:DUF349 domain-containing protein [Gammaproteobacteria bacterium]